MMIVIPNVRTEMETGSARDWDWRTDNSKPLSGMQIKVL